MSYTDTENDTDRPMPWRPNDLVLDAVRIPYAGADGADMNSGNGNAGGSETLKDHVAEFLKAAAEISVAFGKGCCDIVKQSLWNRDSFLVRKFGKDSYIGRNLREPFWRLRRKFSSFNEYLPEDKDPVHSWSVIFFVVVLAFAGQFVRNFDFSLDVFFLKIRIWWRFSLLCGFVVWLLRNCGLRFWLDLGSIGVGKEERCSVFEF